MASPFWEQQGLTGRDFQERLLGFLDKADPRKGFVHDKALLHQLLKTAAADNSAAIAQHVLPADEAVGRALACAPEGPPLAFLSTWSVPSFGDPQTGSYTVVHEEAGDQPPYVGGTLYLLKHSGETFQQGKAPDPRLEGFKVDVYVLYWEPPVETGALDMPPGHIAKSLGSASRPLYGKKLIKCERVVIWHIKKAKQTRQPSAALPIQSTPQPAGPAALTAPAVPTGPLAASLPETRGVESIATRMQSLSIATKSAVLNEKKEQLLTFFIVGDVDGARQMLTSQPEVLRELCNIHDKFQRSVLSLNFSEVKKWPWKDTQAVLKPASWTDRCRMFLMLQELLPEDLPKLFLTVNDNGATPMMQLVYFAAQQAAPTGHSTDQTKDTSANAAGSTSTSAAAAASSTGSGQQQIYDSPLCLLELAIKYLQQHPDIAEQVWFLQSSQSGFLPYHNAMKGGHPVAAEMVVTAMLKLLSDNKHGLKRKHANMNAQDSTDFSSLTLSDIQNWFYHIVCKPYNKDCCDRLQALLQAKVPSFQGPDAHLHELDAKAAFAADELRMEMEAGTESSLSMSLDELLSPAAQ